MAGKPPSPRSRRPPGRRALRKDTKLQKTPIIRLSAVASELGTADAERGVRAFALAFDAETGNWHRVGTNTRKS